MANECCKVMVTRVLVLKPGPAGQATQKERMTRLREELGVITAEELGTAGGVELCIVVDLSSFSLLSSTMIGILGSLRSAEYAHVRMVALCGLQPAAERTARTLQLITEHPENKIRAFENVAAGLTAAVA